MDEHTLLLYWIGGTYGELIGLTGLGGKELGMDIPTRGRDVHTLASEHQTDAGRANANGCVVDRWIFSYVQRKRERKKDNDNTLLIVTVDPAAGC